MAKDLDWQDIANELSEGIRNLHSALDAYNKAFDKADAARAALKDDDSLLEDFTGEWNEAEGSVMAIEEQITDLAKLTDFIEEKLV